MYPCVSVIGTRIVSSIKRDNSPPENNNCCEDHLHAQHGHRFRARANRGSCCETELVHAPLLRAKYFYKSFLPPPFQFLHLSPVIFVARMPPFRKRQMACANHTECFFNLDFHRAQQNWRLQQQRSTHTNNPALIIETNF